MAERGIVNDEDDSYNGTIPYDIIPEEIQAIVYNDTAYRNYLLTRATNELNVTDTKNVFRKNLAISPYINEEDLIMLFLTNIQSRVTTTTSATTTTTTIMSTTPDYRKKSKKSENRFNNHGKHFSNELEKFNSNGGDKTNKFSRSEETKKQSKIIHRYGYIVQTGDPNHYDFFEQKQPSFLKAFHYTFDIRSNNVL